MHFTVSSKTFWKSILKGIHTIYVYDLRDIPDWNLSNIEKMLLSHRRYNRSHFIIHNTLIFYFIYCSYIIFFKR